MTDAMTNHSDIESLAAFVDGRLEREEREAVTKHLETCEECQAMIREAAAFEQEEEAAIAARKPARTWWAAAAAVAVVVLGGASFGREPLHRYELKSDRREMFEAMKERKVEARFSEQHAYAPFAGTNRGVNDQKDLLDEWAVEGKANDLARASADRPSAADRRATALAETIKSPANALAILNNIPESARDAAIWTDIAALRYYLGDNQGALAAVQQALGRNRKMPEALFNHALILQRMGNRKAALEAWKQYVAVDSFSPWANEAPKNILKMRELQ